MEGVGIRWTTVLDLALHATPSSRFFPPCILCPPPAACISFSYNLNIIVMYRCVGDSTVCKLLMC